jgi:hypothetical protein
MRIKDGVYESRLYDGDAIYYIRFKKPSRLMGPSPYKTIMSGDKDVTNEILKYMGPARNFYGIPTSPSMLGYNSLTFATYNDVIHIYSDDQIIKV